MAVRSLFFSDEMRHPIGAQRAGFDGEPARRVTLPTLRRSAADCPDRISQEPVAGITGPMMPEQVVELGGNLIWR